MGQLRVLFIKIGTIPYVELTLIRFLSWVNEPLLRFKTADKVLKPYFKNQTLVEIKYTNQFNLINLLFFSCHLFNFISNSGFFYYLLHRLRLVSKIIKSALLQLKIDSLPVSIKNCIRIHDSERLK